VAAGLLRRVLADHPAGALPWKQLRFLCGDLVYGGRVADEFDRRTLEALFSRFCCAEAMSDGHVFCPGVTEHVALNPHATFAECQDHIEQLPATDSALLFGLHHYADALCARDAASALFSTLRSVSRVSGPIAGPADNLTNRIKLLAAVRYRSRARARACVCVCVFVCVCVCVCAVFLCLYCTVIRWAVVFSLSLFPVPP
jgi:hypothetical protein